MLISTTRLPGASFAARPWRIKEFVHDFDVLDVWALPTPGGRDDFGRLTATVTSFDPAHASPVVRALFAIRRALGRMFSLDGPTDGIDSRITGLQAQLPEDLRNSFPADASTGPFSPLYATADEAALQIANRTVHGVVHLGWVPDGDGGYRGEMAVLVRPNGMLGATYLTAIAPLRHLVVYPAMVRSLARRWRDQTQDRVVVTQIDVPVDVRGLSTLPRIDYADAFLVRTGSSPEWSAERWARAILEDAPAPMQSRLLSGWKMLGLKVGSNAGVGSGAVLGWSVRRSTPEVVLLAADSRIGMPGQLLIMIRPEGLLFATFLQHRTVATRAVWAAVERTHVEVVHTLLERATLREGAMYDALHNLSPKETATWSAPATGWSPQQQS
ncbi:MAG: hypothetical protein QOI01_3508 [Mycobacterium sp.]|jgi:hypothetical protein|nr:hypothetical protein [Mycobacterium sp.]